MEVQILAFGIAKDIVGSRQFSLKIKEGGNVTQLKEKLFEQFPDLAKLTSLLIAVNNEYGNPEQALQERDEIALIPPVSGG